MPTNRPVSSVAVDSVTATNGPTLLLVVGAPGEPEYESNFVHQVRLWQQLAHQAGARLQTIGLQAQSPPDDHDRLRQALASQPRDGLKALWLVLIGHGTFDDQVARFNLRGPDVSATELASWLKPFRRPLVVIDTSAASAPFLPQLSATNRVVITATRSGNEQSFAYFGQYFVAALSDPQSDLDHDGQISLLEAFLSASSQVAEFYRRQGRLATEHALIDDNGDGRGTPAEWFRGLQLIQQPRGGALADGLRARQVFLVLSPAERALPPAIRARRDALERAIAHLRQAKSKLPADEYYQKLEKLLLEMARLVIPSH